MTDVADTQGPEPVPPYARVEVIGGLTMVGLAMLIWFGSINLAVGILPNFGPGALPKVLSLLLGVAGAGIAVQGFVREASAFERFDFAVRPTLIIILAIAVFGLFIRGGNFGLFATPQLGLCTVGPLTIFVSGCAAPRTNVRELLILAFGLTALVLLVFPDLLRLSIPPFPAGLHNAVATTVGLQAGLRIACAAYGVIAVVLYLVTFGRRRQAA